MNTKALVLAVLVAAGIVAPAFIRYLRHRHALARRFPPAKTSLKARVERGDA